MDSGIKSATQAAASARVYWGHQSVGGNIIEGLALLLSEAQATWRVAEVGASPLPDGPGLLHQRIGENGTPKGKIDHFAKAIRSLSDARPDLAFMKLCYADVDRDTNIDNLLEHYTQTLLRLKSEYPTIVFGHATIPLAPAAGSLKDRLKRLAGVEIAKERDNLRRVQYSARLRRAFPNDPMLDLEAIESTRRDGARVQFRLDGQVGYALAGEYAGDGAGHLNATGAKIAATSFVSFVASALAR